VQSYYRSWAARQFGDAQAAEIAEILRDSSRMNARRKPELIDAGYYRTNDDNEAERIAADYARLEQNARTAAGKLPPEQQSAFYQLVQHPIEAMANLHRMYHAIAQGRMDDARVAFANDAAIRQRYEGLQNGKWRHMMSQTHISYSSWQQPEIDVMPEAVSWRPRSLTRKGPSAKAAKDRKRFLEKDGLVVFDAPDFSRASAVGDATWKTIANGQILCGRQRPQRRI
jgi:hypothetical protein